MLSPSLVTFTTLLPACPSMRSSSPRPPSLVNTSLCSHTSHRSDRCKDYLFSAARHLSPDCRLRALFSPRHDRYLFLFKLHVSCSSTHRTCFFNLQFVFKLLLASCLGNIFLSWDCSATGRAASPLLPKQWRRGRLQELDPHTSAYAPTATIMPSLNPSSTYNMSYHLPHNQVGHV